MKLNGKTYRKTLFDDTTTTSLLTGDSLTVLPTLTAESVQCVVTSPPYWGLRDYDRPSQIGSEPSPELYVENLVAIFREVRRVLKKDGLVRRIGSRGDSSQFPTTVRGCKLRSPMSYRSV
ncbi:MAG: DNA methyltransferase [Planctomycetales bacterium]